MNADGSRQRNLTRNPARARLLLRLVAREEAVSVTAPPRPPRQSDPVDRDELEALVEALIEEARQRAQRRRRRNAAVVTLVALVGVALFTILERSAQSQTASPALAARSSLSPRAATSKIALHREPAGGYAGVLWVMNADGSGQRNLSPALSRDATGHPTAGRSPSRRGVTDDRRRDIYVTNADGSGQREADAATAGPDSSPAWSPDGRTIAFVSGRDGNSEIYVMNADGSEQRRLTRNEVGLPAQLAWSPDGQKIAFRSPSRAAPTATWRSTS